MKKTLFSDIYLEEVDSDDVDVFAITESFTIFNEEQQNAYEECLDKYRGNNEEH